MKIYDVSVPLSSATPTYPGDPGIEIKKWMTLVKGDPANVSLINFGLHSGTHVDAPAHFIEGARTVDKLPLTSLVGEVHVIAVPDDRNTIDQEFVAQAVPTGAKRVLFKTRNSNLWNQPERGFQEDYVSIEPAAARKLAADGTMVVGIDYLSVEKFGSKSFETHLALLSQEVVIIEGLDLREVPAGIYELICLPLRIAGASGDGAPARVILRTNA